MQLQSWTSRQGESDATAELNQQTGRINLICDQLHAQALQAKPTNKNCIAHWAWWEAAMSALWPASSPARMKGPEISIWCRPWDGLISMQVASGGVNIQLTSRPSSRFPMHSDLVSSHMLNSSEHRWHVHFFLFNWGVQHLWQSQANLQTCFIILSLCYSMVCSCCLQQIVTVESSAFVHPLTLL